MIILGILKYSGLLLAVVLAWFGLNADDRDAETRRLSKRGKKRVFFILFSTMVSIAALYLDTDHQNKEKAQADLVTHRQLDSLNKILRQMDRSLNPLEDIKIYAEIGVKADSGLNPYFGRLQNFCKEVQRKYNPPPKILDDEYKGIEVYFQDYAFQFLYFSWKAPLFPNLKKDGIKIDDFFNSITLHLNLYRHFDREKFMKNNLRPDMACAFYFFPDPNNTKVIKNDVVYYPKKQAFEAHTVVHKESFNLFKNYNIRSVQDLKECTAIIFLDQTATFDDLAPLVSPEITKFYVSSLDFGYNGLMTTVESRNTQGFKGPYGIHCYIASLKDSDPF